MEPVVTTYIPTFRRPKLVARALRSVLNQTFPHFQVAVYDNASGDDTPDVVQEVSKGDPRVRYICHPENIGAFANIVYGMNQVKTPYFSMLGDDDIMLPDFFAVTLQGFRDHPDAAFSAGRSLLITDSGEPLALMPNAKAGSGYKRPPQGVLSMLSGRLINHFSMGGTLLRTDLAREFWNYEANESYPFDIEFLLKVSARHPYVLSDSVLTLWLMHEDNRRKSRIPLYHGWIRVFRGFLSDSALPAETQARVYRKFLAQLRRAFFKIWSRSVAAGNWEEAYVLSDLVREELEQAWAGKILFQATQLFRKEPYSPRLAKLRAGLERVDRKYITPFREKYLSYADYLRMD